MVQLKSECDLNVSLITLSELGIAIYDDKLRIHPTFAREVFDVTGAGDTVLASLGFAVASEFNIDLAIEFSNLAAGVVIGKIGSATATLNEIIEYESSLNKSNSNEHIKTISEIILLSEDGLDNTTIIGADPVDLDATLTFTNCGQTGYSGPSQDQINSAYTGTALEGLVTGNSGIQYWTVPTTGYYTMEAWGAQGGRTSYSGENGGNGAIMRGDFFLEGGTVLKILVGQEGADGSQSAGGAGGTFIATVENEPLLVAGGGGAANRYENGTDGTHNESGLNANSNDGGTNGGGGEGSSSGGGGGRAAGIRRGERTARLG